MHIEKVAAEIPRLSRLMDTSAIKLMMDDFYRIASIPLGIIDLEGEVLVGVGWQDICTRFHRVHPETRRRCIESDVHLSAGARAGEFKVYKCLNGMWDMATPIIVGGLQLGNVFAGQFFFDDERIDHEFFRAQAAEFHFDEKEYLAALDAVPRLSREKVNAGLSFFTRVADVVATMSYRNAHLARSLSERDALLVNLQESRDDLNRAQTVAHTGSWRLNVDRDELTWSDESYRLFGTPQGTPLTYEKFLSAIHPEDREYVDRKWAAALRGKPYDVEHRIVVGDTVKWVREKAELELKEDGSLLGGFGTVQDITEKKLEEANRTLMTEVLRVLNSGGEMRGLISQTLRLIREATGFEAVGLRLRRGEDCPYFEQNGFSEEFLREENFLCEKGLHGEIVRDEEGRAVLECTCGLVLSGRIDPGMSCFTSSGSFWTNVSHELLALAPEDDPRTRPRNRCIHAGYESVGLFPIRSGGDIIGLLQLNGRRAGLFTPELIAFHENLAQNIGLALQRTMAEEALKKAHAQLQDHARKLEETNKELAGFAYTISHDLRIPLRAMNGFANMVANDYGELLGEEGKRRLAVIEKNAIKMGRLVDDLLSFSRYGRTALSVSRIDMNRLVAEVARALSGSSRASIRIGDLPAAQGDPRLVRQVVVNLLENGLKFSRNHPHPEVEVESLERDGEQIYLVRDNGIGFDMKYVNKLFGVFNRLVTEKDFEGTGVGLAIVHRLVKRHGGRVWAEAKPGEGATFFFTLRSPEQKSA